MKSTFLASLALGLALLAASGCYRRQYREVVLHLPQLKSEACALSVRDRLMALNEKSQNRELLFFQDVLVDANAKTVTVIYNSSVTAGMNVLHLVASMGYDVADQADPKRALPGDPAGRKTLPLACQ